MPSRPRFMTAVSWSSRRRPDSARRRCSTGLRHSRLTPAISCGAPRRHRWSAIFRLRRACGRCSRRPLGARLDDAGADSTQFAHEVLWLCAELAAEQPLALIVDDAQWADRLSLEVLAYLARRVEDLPLLIVVATRECRPTAEPVGTVDRPASRAADAARRRAADRRTRRQSRAPTATARRAATRGCWPSSAPTRSRPTLVGLAVGARRRAAAAGGALAARPRRGRGAGGDRRRRAPHVAAAVAGVPVGELGPARDALQVAGLLAPGGEALRARADRGRDRRRADADRARAPAPRGGAGADGGGRRRARWSPRTCSSAARTATPRSASTCASAAEAAIAAGLPRAAAAYLERALEERAPGDDRGKMLAQLGTVAFDAGLPDSRRLLHEALPRGARPRRPRRRAHAARLAEPRAARRRRAGRAVRRRAGGRERSRRAAGDRGRPAGRAVDRARASRRARTPGRGDRPVARGRPAAPACRARASRVGRHRARHGRRRDRRDAGARGAGRRTVAGGRAPPAGVRDLRARADGGRSSRGRAP